VKAKEVFGRQQLFVFRQVFAAHNFPPVFQKKSSVGSGGFEPNDLLQVDNSRPSEVARVMVWGSVAGFLFRLEKVMHQ
jgi:hypothetical protein